MREPQKMVFKGDPLEKLHDTIKCGRWDEAVAGFEVSSIFFFFD